MNFYIKWLLSTIGIVLTVALLIFGIVHATHFTLWLLMVLFCTTLGWESTNHIAPAKCSAPDIFTFYYELFILKKKPHMDNHFFLYWMLASNCYFFISVVMTTLIMFHIKVLFCAVLLVMIIISGFRVAKWFQSKEEN